VGERYHHLHLVLHQNRHRPRSACLHLPRPPGSQRESSKVLASWGGWGGSQVIADAVRKMTISYMKNKMEHAELGQKKDGAGKDGRVIGNERTKGYVKAIYETLGVL
jgi:hypothetical protein